VDHWLDPHGMSGTGLGQDPVPLERVFADLEATIGRGLSGEVLASALAPLVATVRRQAADIDQLSTSIRDLAEEVVSLRRAQAAAAVPAVTVHVRRSWWARLVSWNWSI